jgi:small-conductance mechanosensitive channel
MVPAVATITGYSIGLFIHILAVVLAFGPTFAYGIFFSVLPKYPAATPALIEGIQRVDKYLVNAGSIVVLLAGIYLMVEGNWDGEFWITIGFVAIIALLGLQHGFFRPQTARAKELAERDLKAGDTLSAEFEEISRRLGTVGSVAGLIVVVTIFFMTVKP